MANCAIPFCDSKSRNGKRMFQLPKNPLTSEIWKEFMVKFGVKKINENSRLCELHFSIDKHGVRSKVPLFMVEKIEVK